MQVDVLFFLTISAIFASFGQVFTMFVHFWQFWRFWPPLTNYFFGHFCLLFGQVWPFLDYFAIFSSLGHLLRTSFWTQRQQFFSFSLFIPMRVMRRVVWHNPQSAGHWGSLFPASSNSFWAGPPRGGGGLFSDALFRTRPDPKATQALHAQYVHALQSLFDEYKGRLGYDDRTLHILDAHHPYWHMLCLFPRGFVLRHSSVLLYSIPG